MYANILAILAIGGLALCQISCSLGDDATGPAVLTDAAQHGGDDTSNEKPSQVGQADEYLTVGGSACRAACWGAATLGCGVVGAACTGTTVITIGSTTIPCVWAVVAACTANSVGASICSDLCPP